MTEVLAQGLMFFIAGYETTATSIAFLLYNLSLNPEIQEKLYKEIIDTAGDQVSFDLSLEYVNRPHSLQFHRAYKLNSLCPL